jgi:DNA-binding beta-propeller fold protein YncE
VTVRKLGFSEEIGVPGRRRRLALTLCCAAALALSAAAPAGAANRIYWANYAANTISWANLDGSGGGELPTTGAPLDGPMGLAVDSATGRLYISNYGSTGVSNLISWANLDGSGGGGFQTGNATVSGPHGVAIDPVTRRLYWANAHVDLISWANLDGSGSGDLPIGACLNEPRGVAIDPGARKIYWANYSAPTNSGEAIGSANLDGSDCNLLNTGSASNTQPEGVALDGAGKIYWASFSAADTISWANLDGSGGSDLSTPGVTPDHPHGVAIDPVAHKIYWANNDANSISWANLDGSGGGNIPTPGAHPTEPDQPILLEVPAGIGGPQLVGHSHPGSKLQCNPARWAGDSFASLLYRAPESVSVRWTKGAKAVRHAKSRSLKAHSDGNFRCVETASNPAGSASQRSEVLAVFEIGRAKLNESNGTARLPVKVPGHGKLALSGKGVVKQPRGHARFSTALRRKSRPHTIDLLVKPKGKTKRRLNRTGRAKVKVTVTDTPKGGGPDSQTKTIRLKKFR